MEQLIIFLLFVVGSIISSIIQNKKRKAEEQQQQELEELTRRSRGETSTERKPIEAWPKSATDWQEQLRRMLEGATEGPPVIKPVIVPPPPRPQPAPVKPPARQISEIPEGDLVFKSPLKTSAENYQRAANLHSNVQERMRAIDLQTPAARTAAPVHRRGRVPSEFVQRLKRNPHAIREAFIASVIFAPPKGLETAEAEAGR